MPSESRSTEIGDTKIRVLLLFYRPVVHTCGRQKASDFCIR